MCPPLIVVVVVVVVLLLAHSHHSASVSPARLAKHQRQDTLLANTARGNSATASPVNAESCSNRSILHAAHELPRHSRQGMLTNTRRYLADCKPSTPRTCNKQLL
ncbi:uncharacterized protein LOC143209287 [Lasioglossum baleicum]|uniref:uncharacterized protein LOC143209287 n=1 Tax=Lasioglossum baleicum TaxID=434251 RepID=UPI003FCDB7F5